MRMIASWSGSKRTYRIQVCGTKMRPTASSPSDPPRSDTQPPTRHEAMQKARLAVHRRSACSGVKALRNTSDARRHAAKLCYRFGPLPPSARSANLIAGDGTKNGFPAPNKEPTINQNHYLTAKAPYKFESSSLHRRVRNEPCAAREARMPAKAHMGWKRGRKKNTGPIGGDPYREVAGKLREVARECQLPRARQEILDLAERFEHRATARDRRAASAGSGQTDSG
jgi:hypothetical protein